jgi:hypothetical protein
MGWEQSELQTKSSVTGNNPERTAREVLALDASILRVLVVGKEGNVLARVQREEFGKRLQVPSSLEEKSGAITGISLGLVDEVSHALGGLDYMISAYKTCKILSVPVFSVSWVVVLVTLRSSEEGYLADKVRSLLGS